MMWNAIQWVTTGLTLVAFLAAIAAWVVRLKILEKERLLRTAPEEKRAELVAAALEFFHVDTRRLTKQQQFDLATQQIRARASRFLLTTILVGIIALVALASVVAVTAFAMVNGNSPRPNSLFQIIDAKTGDAVRCALTVHYTSDGLEGQPITVEDRYQGQFALPGDVVITDVEGFAGYEFRREDRHETRDSRRLLKLQRTREFVDAIKPASFKLTVPKSSFDAELNAPGQPDPGEVAFTCKNTTKYTVDLFFYRYFPPGQRPQFVPDKLEGPVTCPGGDKVTLVWNEFGSPRGGAFFFYASIGGSKARLVADRAGNPKPAYVLKSLNPELVLLPNGDWLAGEVGHNSSSSARDGG